MNERELERLFSDADQTKPDPKQKQRAIDAALAEFSANTSQGNADSTRPTTNIMNLSRMQKMKRWTYSSMASAAGLVLAVTFSLTLFKPDMVSGPVPDNQELLGQPSSADEARNESARRTAEQAAASKRSSESLSQDLARLNSQTITAMKGNAAESSFSRSSPSAGSPSMSSPVHILPTPRLAEDRAAFEEQRDQFSTFDTNPVLSVTDTPVSTFSIDVDTASYSFVRRKLNQGLLPQKAAVRVEEMINYFPYDYPAATSMEQPFKPTVSVMDSPWNSNNKLIHIGIKGFEPEATIMARSNIVFLLDVSGSMNAADKLPLVKQSMSLLLSELHPEDTVSIVVYAGAAGAVLEPTRVAEKQKILSAMNRLKAGGSTAGAAGIELAYQLAESSFVEGGVNRIFLATDGDFNVGTTNRDSLQGFVERKRETGIYLSVLGFGQGNYQDALMQKLAQNGNGIAAYIDTLSEAQKVLVQEAKSQLFPIANDVKIQVEFNPNTVSEYRLLGYETRALKQEDFNNDKVDAGEIGMGHSVTAIYEVTPKGSTGLLDPSRYGAEAETSSTSDEYGFLKIRFKKPGESTSQLITQPIKSSDTAITADARFAVAVAGFAELLRGGTYTGDWTWDDALELALANRGEDIYGYRSEFVQLVRTAKLADASMQ